MSRRVEVSITNNIAQVMLNRPEKLNSVDIEMFHELCGALERLASEEGVRVAILSGNGRAFSAGLDLAAMASAGTGLDLSRRDFGPANLAQQVAWGWRSLSMPVIAAVHGVAFGAGLQIMSGADIRIGHHDTRLSIRETYWGLVPDMAGIALWRTTVRDDVLRELTYTAREFSGEEAQRFGFFTRLSDDPLRDALELARTISERSPDAISAAKRLYNLAADADSVALLEAESAEQVTLKGSVNQLEAVRAHVERRATRFVD